MLIALAIMNFYDHGAARRDFRDLALELSHRGHRVIILSKSWHSETLPDIQHVKFSAFGIGKIGKLISFGRKVRDYCEEHDVDLLIAFSRIPGADFYYVGNHVLEKHRFRFRNLFSLTFWEKHFLEKKLFSPVSATKILALVPAQIDILTHKFHTPKERVTLLPLGVPVECRRLKESEIDACRRELRKQYSISDQEKVLMMVGPGFYNKGVDRAIAALSYLPREALNQFRLVVCGKGAISKMDALARHYNVKNRVIFGNHISRSALLSAADLTLCLSRREFLESTPLESIACGTPVILSSLNQFRDFAEKAGGIILPEPFHANALAQLLLRLVKEPDFYDAMKRQVVSQDPEVLYHRVERMADLIESAKR